MNTTTILNGSTIPGRAVLFTCLLLCVGIFTPLLHAATTPATAERDTLERLVSASYAGVVPTEVVDGAVYALFGEGGSTLRVQVGDGATAAYGISAGMLAYRVDEDLYLVELRNGERRRLLQRVPALQFAWKPRSRLYAALVRTPDGLSVIAGDADDDSDDVEVVDPGTARADQFQWNDRDQLEASATTAIGVTPNAFGDYLGEFNGVGIYSNGKSTFGDGPKNYVDGVYTGISWQCVEYVQRYYWKIYGANLAAKRRGNANDFYVNASLRDLDRYANGGSTPPETGDILVSEGGTFGHVAIVRSRTADKVCTAQQNFSNSTADVNRCLTLTVKNGLYTVGGFSTTYPIRGWTRRKGSSGGGGGTSGKAATMISPAPGSTFNGSSQTFTWTAGQGASQYYLYIGSTFASGDIYAYNANTSTSVTAGNLPTNGMTLYVRLWTLISGAWQAVDYQYRAATSYTGSPAQMQSPAPGSTLSGSAQTFVWSKGQNVSTYFLYVGTYAGGSDLYAASMGTSTSAYVVNLPTNGAILYVRLWSLINAQWQYKDYSYRAATGSYGGSEAARMISPSPGTTLSATQTFTWTRGQNVSQYYVYIGTAPGAANIYSAGTVATSLTVSLPRNGTMLYVRLWSLINGNWQGIDYQYRASVW